MDAIILAGGLGTRLKEVIKDVPKPMAPVNGKPFLQYILDWLSSYPVKKIILSVGYKYEAIKDYFGDNYGNIPIEYAIENEPLGTGGGVKKALKKTTEDNVVIINGDTYFPININELLEFHIANRSSVTIALKRMGNFDRYGSISITGNVITKFEEKRYCKSGLINGGIYMLNKEITNLIQNYPDKFSFEKDLLEKGLGTGFVQGIVFDESFIDIGIPEDYLKSQSIFK
jgi:D-glycero-alpha-D-manno-heptose 1-phosphate guanylyltransferase